GLIFPPSVVSFHVSSITTRCRSACVGPQSPDQTPTSGWPCWATAAGIDSINSDARMPTTQKKLARIPAPGLGDNRARTVDLFVYAVAANHQLASEVAILAYEFEHFPSRRVAHQHTGRPRRRVGAWIVDSDFIAQRLEIEARPFFDEVKLLRGWRSVRVDPPAFVEADGVDDESVALPAAYRMSVVAGV